MKEFIKEFRDAKDYKVSLWYNTKLNYWLSFSKSLLTKLPEQTGYELIISFE